MDFDHARPTTPHAWHAMTADEALARLGADRHGLSTGDAARRLGEYGPNSLPAAKPRSALARLLAQFNNLLIYVLLAAAAITALLGHGLDTAVILAVVVLNAVIGFVQEGRAEQALEAIREMLTPHASVLRDGRRITIDAEDLVPGDVVLIEAGDRVPADLRLIRSRGLQVQEAVLTGESVPVEKSPEPVPLDAPLGDRRGMAFSGTLVTAGQGTGLVVSSGSTTELGRISALIGSVESLTTPLLRRMDALARQLTVVILGLSGLVFAFAVLLRGYAVDEAFIAVVALAVAAIPEGLPAVMTVTLAIGVRRMAARNAIIRRLPAVETLGSVSIICSDKTGTLTRNEMMVAAVAVGGALVEVTGTGYEPRGSFLMVGRDIDADTHRRVEELARAALLCNDAALREAEGGWAVDGDPMEGALLAFALKAGHEPAAERDRLTRLDEIPFDAGHRYMATLHRDGADGAIVFLKGAPERVLAMCDCQRGAQGDEPLSRGAWNAAVEALASRGLRVLALAAKPVAGATVSIDHHDVECGLTLLGLTGLVDPPREEAVAAVRDCLEAGIAVKMITGDHAATAKAIARALGIERSERVTTGHDIDRADAEELRRVAQDSDVFARTSPEHKLRLVEALQAEGAVVAMTGDGVNDAPALKRADIGIAMGRKGTEAAKEAAEMVLADDNFASIAAAVREGRTIYDNLTKVIAWTLPTNGGEALSVIAAILLGLTLPLTPLQILWVNLVTAVALGMTLAFEPTEPGTMRRPPRSHNEPLLSGLLIWRVVLVSLLFVAAVFGLFFSSLSRGVSLEEARTVAVNGLVTLEIFYLFSVRYLRTPSVTFQGILGTRAVLIGVSATAVLQLAFTYAPPLQALFATRAIGLAEGAAILATGIALLLVLEIEKAIRARLGSASHRGPSRSGSVTTGRPQPPTPHDRARPAPNRTESDS